MSTIPGKPFRRSKVDAGGFTLDYAEAGPPDAAITIVSLPGSAGLEMSTAKDVLSQRCRVIEINPPGFGDNNDLTRPTTQSEIGAVLAEAANKLVKGRYYIIGTSMGGGNALYAAMHAPDRVAGLILEGSMTPVRMQDLQSPPPTPEQLEALKKAGGPPPYPDRPPHPKKPWASSAYVAKQMGDRIRMFQWVATDFEGEAAVRAARERRTPIVALLGDEDEILKTSQAEAFKAVLPHAEFHLITGGTHDLQNTTPDQFVQQVEAFVGV